MPRPRSCRPCRSSLIRIVWVVINRRTLSPTLEKQRIRLALVAEILRGTSHSFRPISQMLPPLIPRAIVGGKPMASPWIKSSSLGSSNPRIQIAIQNRSISGSISSHFNSCRTDARPRLFLLAFDRRQQTIQVDHVAECTRAERPLKRGQLLGRDAAPGQHRRRRWRSRMRERLAAPAGGDGQRLRSSASSSAGRGFSSTGAQRHQDPVWNDPLFRNGRTSSTELGICGSMCTGTWASIRMRSPRFRQKSF